MTSLHADLNEAAKFVDYSVHIASLLIAPSHTRTKYKMATTFGLTYEDSLTNFRKLGASKLGKSLRGEWPSGLYSLRQVTEVKLGRVRSDFGWVTTEA